MDALVLKRVSTNWHSTFGVLIDGTEPFALTLERPWRENEENVSCIPANLYMCKRIQSPRFGETFEVMDVPGRSNILFHKGNVVEDTAGCILVGERFEKHMNQPAVLSSADGFKELMYRMKETNRFFLSIVWCKF